MAAGRAMRAPRPGRRTNLELLARSLALLPFPRPALSVAAFNLRAAPGMSLTNRCRAGGHLILSFLQKLMCPFLGRCAPLIWDNRNSKRVIFPLVFVLAILIENAAQALDFKLQFIISNYDCGLAKNGRCERHLAAN